MLVLAIDTSTLQGSVALCSVTPETQQLIAEVNLSVSSKHSERLLPCIDQIFKWTGHTLDDVDLFAVSRGPGSFTGLRIGCSVMQGFALARQKPVVGVSSLQVLACAGIPFSGMLIPVMNAFRSQVYAGFYRYDAEQKIPVSQGPDVCCDPELLVDSLNQLNESCLVLGPGLSVLAPVRGSFQNVLALPAAYSRASCLAGLAFAEFSGASLSEKGVFPGFLNALPVYLRQPG